MIATAKSADIPAQASTPARPRSAVAVSTGLAGLAGLCAAWIAGRLIVKSDLVATWLVLLGTALPMLAIEMRAARRSIVAPALAPARSPAKWLAGLSLALCPVIATHLIWAGAPLLVGAALVIAPALALRVLVLERANWFSGFHADLPRWLTGTGPAPGWEKARLWTLKGLFIPFYAYGLGALIATTRSLPLENLGDGLILLVCLCIVVDLTFGLAGYLFASNALFVSVRSTNPSLLAWVWCLACYPMTNVKWEAFGTVAQSEVTWARIAAGHDGALVGIGTALMLTSLMVYISATIVHGLRFANLANRGVITSGPYRWFKHPAYTAHIANSWIIVAIFLPAAGIAMTPAILVMPAAFTALYILRMRTEETHLREDPAYVAYERWIDEYGLLARIRRVLRGSRGPRQEAAAAPRPTA